MTQDTGLAAGVFTALTVADFLSSHTPSPEQQTGA
jgi:hypothetical protein